MCTGTGIKNTWFFLVFVKLLSNFMLIKVMTHPRFWNVIWNDSYFFLTCFFLIQTSHKVTSYSNFINHVNNIYTILSNFICIKSKFKFIIIRNYFPKYYIINFIHDLKTMLLLYVFKKFNKFFLL